MRTITINLCVTDAQWDLLCTGKCEKPHPERVKRMLLSEAARNVRTLIERGLQDAPVQVLARTPVLKPALSKTARAKLDNAERRAEWERDRERKAEYAERLITEGKRRARDNDGPTKIN